MCGRYVIISTPEAIRALFGYGEQPNFPPRYNVAPTQPIPIVRLVDGKRSFALMRWGLLPSWVKDPKTFPLLINARGESVLEKPAFRNAMRRRRCLIPTDGFYEWQAREHWPAEAAVFRARQTRRRRHRAAARLRRPVRNLDRAERRRDRYRRHHHHDGEPHALPPSTSACRCSCRRKLSTLARLRQCRGRRRRGPDRAGRRERCSKSTRSPPRSIASPTIPRRSLRRVPAGAAPERPTNSPAVKRKKQNSQNHPTVRLVAAQRA